MLGERTEVEDPGHTQRAPEGATPLRQRETSRIGVHVRAPPRQSAGRIGQEHTLLAGPGRDNT
jgi:hypothetical protein